MTGVGENDSSLATQCLALCQALASQGMEFNFSLTIGSTFSFSLDTKSKEALSSKAKKKVSPSTLRRNKKRREEFLKKKSMPSEAEKSESDKEASQDATFQCDQCENIFKNEKGLKIHMGRAHKTVSPVEKKQSSSPESLRQPASYSSVASKSLSLSSLSDTEDREDELRFQEEIRFHKENPNTCEFCRKKCDLKVDMMEQCVVTGGRHSIPLY